MTYERFLKITLRLQKEGKTLNTIYQSGVSLIDFVDPYHDVIGELIKEIYGDTGYDWWSWFCYENDYGQGGLTAYDKNGDLICHSLESLWDYLETLRKK
jgi:hypothetical protein